MVWKVGTEELTVLPFPTFPTFPTYRPDYAVG